MESEQIRKDRKVPPSEVREQEPKARAERPLRQRISSSSILTLVTLTIVGCLVIIPRPTSPQILPLPKIDTARLGAREKEELKRARLALDGSLDKETRAVGEQVRRLGLILSKGTPVQGHALVELRRDASALAQRPSTKHELSGQESLLRLRALQAQMFLEAVWRWQNDGKASLELQELGGPFYQIAAEAWVDDKGNPVLTEDELRLLFRVHWGKLTGLHEKAPFSPTLEELRRYYSANLRFPVAPKGDLVGQARVQLGFARALSKVDPDYPGALAQGILQMRMGNALGASQTLKAHLEAYPDGPWTQLATSHLLSAVRSADEVGAGRAE